MTFRATILGFMQKKTLCTGIVTSLFLSLLPLPAVAAGQLIVHDSIAGLETYATINGFPANATVVLGLLTPSDEVSLPAQTNTQGQATMMIPAALTKEAGQYAAFAKLNGARVTPDAAFVVLPDRVSAADSSIHTNTPTFDADGTATATVTVTLTDRFGNPLAGRPVELITSRSADRVRSLDDETDASGAQHFSVSTTQAGEIAVRALDVLSGQTLTQSLHLTAMQGRGGPPVVSRNPLTAQVSTTASTGEDDEAVEFQMELRPSSPRIGQELDLFVTALREDGSVAQGYTRSPSIWAPNDPEAIVPGFGTLIFRKAENGEKYCPQCVTFTVPGPQSLIVEDTLSNGQTIRGEVRIDVASSPEYDQTRKIQVLSHRDHGKIAEANIVLEGIGPALANLLVTGGLQDTQAETDAKGMFSIPLALDPAYSEYTIRIRSIDDSGQTGSSLYDSGNLHLVRDNTGPEITFQFDPQEPVEGQDMQLNVSSEPDLPSVTVELGERTLTLSEDQDRKGTYSVLFLAPPAGDFQPAIIAVDEAGNRTEVRGILRVLPKGLPQVQNVRAQPGSTGIALTWDVLNEPNVTSYVVSVGTTENVSDTTLETDGTTTNVNVMGLQSGTIYYFAVAGKQGDITGEKSTIVSAPFGPHLTITPGVGMLTLDWEYTDSTSVAEYLLEFSAEEGIYTNRIDITAAEPGPDGIRRQRFVLHDLLDATTYSLRFTPRATTTELLTILTTEHTATTLDANGFQPRDDTGTSPFDGAPSNDLHSGAPSIPDSGLPAYTLAIIALIAVAVFFLRRRGQKKATQAFLQQMQSRYHQ